MFSKLYITIKSDNEFDDSIIDPISFILIDWDIYPNRAKLEISTDDRNYKSYSITYQGMNSIMELCYKDEFVMTIIDNNGPSETYTMYFSEPNSINFATDISELID